MIQDMKLERSLADVDHTKTNLSYQEALILAMKKEKEKFKFYIAMAENAENEECKNTFLSLANEEARQKLKFEIEYDQFILVEN
jgi:rubrerythrin